MSVNHLPPHSGLELELREVSTDAKEFDDFINADNSLPKTFPKEHTQKVLASLIDLHTGTLAGCKEPLEYARARLARIRSQHIILESNYANDGRADEPPPIVRGLTLDSYLIRLLASVSTALDRYYQITSSYPDEEPLIEVRVNRSEHLADLNTVRERNSKLTKDTAEIEDELLQIKCPGSKTSENFIRQSRDIGNLSKMVAAETELETTSARWLRRFGVTFQTYSVVLKQTGNLIVRGTDVIEIFWVRWHHLKERLGLVVIEEARSLGEQLLDLGTTYEAERETKSYGGANADQLTNPGEREELEKIIRSASHRIRSPAIEEYAERYSDPNAISFMKGQLFENADVSARLTCLRALVLGPSSPQPWNYRSPLKDDEIAHSLQSIFSLAAESDAAKAAILSSPDILFSAAVMQKIASLIGDMGVPKDVRSVAFDLLVRKCETPDSKKATQVVADLIRYGELHVIGFIMGELAKSDETGLKGRIIILHYLSNRLQRATPNEVYTILQKHLSNPHLGQTEQSMIVGILRGRRI